MSNNNLQARAVFNSAIQGPKNYDPKARAAFSSMIQGPKNDDPEGRAAFNSAIQALRAQIANVGAHLELDSSARQAYDRQIRAMANNLQSEAMSGRITWIQAARQAQEMRNTLMEIIRWRSSPVGRAMAQKLKSQGKTLNELIARKAQQIHGPNVQFNRLTTAQQNVVYSEIVKSAGKSNPQVTKTMRGLSRAGRGLLFVSLALSVYNVSTADNKPAAARKEIAVTGAGIAGGMAGGALAGLACGPGAPACVAIGAFVGGAMAAFGTDYFW